MPLCLCVCVCVCIPEGRDAPVRIERSTDSEKKQKLKPPRPSARTLRALSAGPKETKPCQCCLSNSSRLKFQFMKMFHRSFKCSREYNHISPITLALTVTYLSEYSLTNTLTPARLMAVCRAGRLIHLPRIWFSPGAWSI